MISHGTLLFNTDLGEVANAFEVKMSKIISKGHKSVRSRVANISEFITKPLKIADFRALLLRGLYEEMEPFETYHLTAEEWKAVHSLKEEKYDSWDWNYGRSPKCNIQQRKRFPVGEIDVRMFVEKGYLAGLKIFGDFFGQKSLETLENILTGVKYDKEEISKKLNGFKIEEYFGNVSTPEFIELLFSTDS